MDDIVFATFVVLSTVRVYGIIFLLSVACGGCVYIPATPRLATTQPDLMHCIGDKDSDRPIRPGISQEEVINRLGAPARRSLDGTKLAYGAKYVRGHWVGWIVRIAPANEHLFTSIPKYRWFTVRLDFDANHRLKSFETFQTDSWPSLQWGDVDVGALDILMPGQDSETLIPEYVAWQQELRDTSEGRGHTSSPTTTGE